LGIGTLAVRAYLADWAGEVPDEDLAYVLPRRVKTCGPANRFRFVLFCEKEGFDDLLAQAQIQERYDVALMSTKGMSVTAARRLVERLCEAGVIVLVLHDFDKSGISILNTLRTSNHRFRYKRKPKVIDLGLRLEDVRRLGLSGEPVIYKSKVDPRVNLKKSGATEAERKFLVSGGGGKRWEGKRVELNELTSPQLIAYVEAKLKEHGVQKVVPEGEALEAAYRIQVGKVKVQTAIDQAVKAAAGAAAEVPEGLRDRLGEMIEGKPTPWDEALWEVATEQARSALTFQGGAGI
jgi:hypothetical protein